MVYSDSAIEAMPTLGAVYHLRLRQTHGFIKSVFELLGLDLPVASVATLCRRRKALSIEPWGRDIIEIFEPGTTPTYQQRAPPEQRTPSS